MRDLRPGRWMIRYRARPRSGGTIEGLMPVQATTEESAVQIFEGRTSRNRWVDCVVDAVLPPQELQPQEEAS